MIQNRADNKYTVVESIRSEVMDSKFSPVRRASSFFPTPFRPFPVISPLFIPYHAWVGVARPVEIRRLTCFWINLETPEKL